MDVDTIRNVAETAIQRASAATGADFTFLLGAARRESAFNPSAHASTSSAAGLFQFLDQTWLATLKLHGAKYGYAHYAALIQQAPDGRYFVEGADARKTVMDLKLDPHAAALMAGELASDHAAYLRGRVGRDPTPGELYAAHVLGPKGSAMLIDTMRSNPSATAAPFFPEAAAANHGLFFRGGRAVSVGELYADLTREPATGPAVTPAAETFTQYAAARRIDHEARERALTGLMLRGPEPNDESRASLAQPMFSDETLRALTTARSEP
jgi:hypothetical protein